MCTILLARINQNANIKLPSADAIRTKRVHVYLYLVVIVMKIFSVEFYAECAQGFKF